MNYFSNIKAYMKKSTSIDRVDNKEESFQSNYKTIKILLIGNSGVGKSSILLQFSDKKFIHNYYNTIGVDYKIKYYPVNHDQNNKVKLQIWDTAGQDRFKNITSSYYRGADGIIIAYDVTDRQSFDNVQNWMEEIEKYVDQKTKKYIVGNKTDLQEKRQVTPQEGASFAKSINVPFKETSARLSLNIDQVFQDLVASILNESSPTITQPSNPNLKLLLETKKKQNQNVCC